MGCRYGPASPRRGAPRSEQGPTRASPSPCSLPGGSRDGAAEAAERSGPSGGSTGAAAERGLAKEAAAAGPGAVPVPVGWQRVSGRRRSGRTAGRIDVCFVR